MHSHPRPGCVVDGDCGHCPWTSTGAEGCAKCTFTPAFTLTALDVNIQVNRGPAGPAGHRALMAALGAEAHGAYGGGRAHTARTPETGLGVSTYGIIHQPGGGGGLLGPALLRGQGVVSKPDAWGGVFDQDGRPPGSMGRGAHTRGFAPAWPGSMGSGAASARSGRPRVTVAACAHARA